uniref:transposase n=1 Tax=Lactobacillus bombicola TaxID=1505723 RepID=UPI0015F7AC60|nr:transposase [Lactobacillus bombicola]
MQPLKDQVHNQLLKFHIQKHDQAAILAAFKPLHHAHDLTAAHEILGQFYKNWSKKHSRVIKQLQAIEDEILAFMAFPPQNRVSIYSTNQIASFNKRLKRKTKAKEQFPTEDSLDNFVGQQVFAYNSSAAATRVARGFSGILDTT